MPTYQDTLDMNGNTQLIGLPVFHALTNTMTWTAFVFNNATSGTYIGYSELGNALRRWQLTNSNNPMWQLLGDATRVRPMPLLEGDNTIVFATLITCRITLTAVAPSISQWWVPSDHGNYGTLQSLSPGGAGKLKFINSKTTFFQFAPGEASGVSITLKPGCRGVVQLVPWLGIPPLQQKFDGSDWMVSGQPWPYYGPVPTTPT